MIAARHAWPSPDFAAAVAACKLRSLDALPVMMRAGVAGPVVAPAKPVPGLTLDPAATPGAGAGAEKGTALPRPSIESADATDGRGRLGESGMLRALGALAAAIRVAVRLARRTDECETSSTLVSAAPIASRDALAVPGATADTAPTASFIVVGSVLSRAVRGSPAALVITEGAT